MNAISTKTVQYVSIKTVVIVSFIIAIVLAFAGSLAMYKLNNYRATVVEQQQRIDSLVSLEAMNYNINTTLNKRLQDRETELVRVTLALGEASAALDDAANRIAAKSAHEIVLASNLKLREKQIASALIPEPTIGKAFSVHVVKPVKETAHDVKESTQSFASKTWDKVASYF